MAVVTYSLKKDGNKNITENFKVKEFACKGYDEVKIDSNLVTILQRIRDHFGKPVNVSSGYRPAAYNATIPTASSTSKHILGRAADISITGISPISIAMYAQSIGARGIGMYVYLDKKGVNNGFVHIDTRSKDNDQTVYRGLYTNSSQSQYVSCGVKFFPTLKKGSTGYVVLLLQRLLNTVGYKLSEDKSFGPATLSAVQSFQKSAGLAVDGSCGPLTWEALLKKAKVWY